MARLLDADFYGEHRIADPNRDHYLDSRPSVARTLSPEDDDPTHIKSQGVREIPSLREVIKIFEGVNSASGVVMVHLPHIEDFPPKN